MRDRLRAVLYGIAAVNLLHDRCARRQDGFSKPVASLFGAHQVARTRDIGEALVARLDQVTPGEIASLNVVGEDLRHLRLWDVLIDQHDPPDTVDGGRERSVGVMMIGCEQQAVDKPRLELLDIFEAFETGSHRGGD
ncbi:MAG: hypothetical protein WAN05_13435 [Roseiarcus sp.]